MDKDCGIKDYFLSLPEESRFDLFRKLRHEIVQPMHMLLGYSDLIETNIKGNENTKNILGIELLLEETLDLGTTIHNLSLQINEIRKSGPNELEKNLTTMEELFMKSIYPITEVQINGSHPKLNSYYSKLKSAKGCLKFTLSEIFNCQENEGFYFHQFLNLTYGLNNEVFENNGITFHNTKNELITRLSYGSTLNSLIGNAIKHSRASKIRIQFEERKQFQDYKVSVIDNGKGINPFAIYQSAIEEGIISYGTQLSDYQRLQLVFENGVKTEYSNANSMLCNFGTSEGLGLSGIKDRVIGRGGQVWVEPVPSGACFCFTIPKKLVICSQKR